MYTAVWNGQEIAQAKEEEIIKIEGNTYFPLESVNQEYLQENPTKHTTCHWKGTADYYDLVVDGQKNEAAVWRYPEPKEGSIERVGQDYSNHVAFWHGVEVKTS